MVFDAGKALELARALAVPRRVGSPGERQALTLIRATLEAYGWEVEAHRFDASDAVDPILAAYIGGLAALVALTFAAWAGPPWLSVALALALLAALAAAGPVGRWLGPALAAGSNDEPASGTVRWLRSLGPRHQTYNLAARLAPAAGGKHPSLLLVAHWDSKSQAAPLWARMALIAAGGTAAAVFAVLSLARNVWPGLSPVAGACGLAALLAALPVVWLYVAGSGNHSPGALDNAAGVALLVQAAEALRRIPPGVNVTLLFTGAEELGLQGAAAYARARQRGGAIGDLWVLNVDGVGTDGPLAYVGRGDSRLAKHVRAAGAALGRPVRRLAWAGAWLDHMPFEAAGAQAISLVSVGAAARRVHTPLDGAQGLSEDGLRRAGALVLGVISRIELEGAPGGGVEQGAG